MTNLEEILGPATPDLLEPDYVVGVVRYNGVIHWLLSDHENWVLDWKKRHDEGIAAGYQIPDLEIVAKERSGLVVVDENTAEAFLGSPDVHELKLDFLRQGLLDRFAAATSWWDLEGLFPIVFVDFDNKRLIGFYPRGPRLERYVPDGWEGVFEDFSNTLPEEIFPAADKFWIVDGRDLLSELVARGFATEAARKAVEQGTADGTAGTAPAAGVVRLFRNCVRKLWGHSA